uniref:methyl-accepting chemotaxis protein n=1 Tax=Acetatifactor sp. TaxID=1872090 RepID=UPI004057C4CB
MKKKKMKPKKQKKNEKQVNGKVKFGIGMQIFACFLILVVFIVAVGVQGYTSASEGLRAKYEESTLETLKMTVEYVDLGRGFVESEGIKYAFASNLVEYYRGFYKSDAKGRAELLKETNDTLQAAAISNSFINNIHIITAAGVDTLTTKRGATTSTPDGFLKEFKAEMDEIYGEGQMPKWIDSHPLVDEKMKLTTEDTLFSYAVQATSGSAYIIVDMKKQAVLDILEQINLGEGSIVGIVTAGGKEAIAGREESALFTELPIYQECLTAEELNGYTEINYQGQKYLFIYSRNADGYYTICALTPMSTITAQADEIRQVTMIMVMLAGIIAVLVGILISTKIGRNMKRLISTMSAVGKGDLTVEIKSRAKDEFGQMNSAMNHMVGNTRKLVKKVADSTGTLGEITRSVTETTDIINEYSENITGAIEEIHSGMNVQAESAQECLQKTDSLSERIQIISGKVEEIETLIRATDEKILLGIDTMQILGERAAQTNEKTNKVEESIVLLQEKFGEIEGFVETINSISEETNLLSLNASIEAARAGESGRGFAVVADQIRKLAEGSAQASAEIQKTVGGILEQTDISVEDARGAKQMVVLQTKAVEEIRVAFTAMQKHMAEVIEQMREITVNTELADSERGATLQSIESISAVIEETVAAVTVLNESAGSLLSHAGVLKDGADILDGSMRDLETEIGQFKIEK